MIKAGSIVRVDDICFSRPKQATRQSAILAATPDGDPVIDSRKSALKASARGETKRVGVMGRVLSIKDDLVVFENLMSEKVEHALLKHCREVEVCVDCGIKEVRIAGHMCNRCRKHSKGTR